MANPVGVIALGLLGLVGVSCGLAILTNWRGWGTRFYRLTTRWPLPGASFYREWGFETFRWLIGGGYLAVGLLFLLLAGWGAAR